MLDHTAKFMYRADIDGLRAIAVLGVVLFHADLGVTGGFVGVDVFFVISGYLITSLILRDLHAGKFSLIEFWERRARRIFPALAVVVVACLIAGWFLLLPFAYQTVGQSVVAVTVFASNIQFWRTSGYFDPLAEENPLLHTWSLSVEEQFYLIVPLVLCLLFYLRCQMRIGIILCVGLIISFVVSVYSIEMDPDAAFYLLPSRAWEIGAGSLLVFARPVSNEPIRRLMGWIGLCCIMYALFYYSPDTLFPGVAAILPVIGAAAIIWSGFPIDSKITYSGVNKLLSNKGLVAIGLISYSLYLWHWPFFAFHRYLFSESPGVPVALTYIVISVLLSVLSLLYIERPFRERKWAYNRRRIFLYTGLVSLFTLCAGIALWQTRGMPSRLPSIVADYDMVKGDETFAVQDPSKRLVWLGESGKSCKVMMWGDSHAGVLKFMLHDICVRHGASAVAVSKGGVAPVLGWCRVQSDGPIFNEKNEYAESVFREIQELVEKEGLEHIVLAFRWGYYVDTLHRTGNIPRPVQGFPDALIFTIKQLEGLGLKVSILLEVPIFEMHVAKAVALHYWHGLPLPHLSSKQHAQRLKNYLPVVQKIRDETPNVNLIDVTHCLTSENGEVRFMDQNGVLLYRDEHHLTKTGSMLLKPVFEKIFFN
ncbi:acyltransferase [Oceaniferula spumae]|uniref:Acyltransferase n=1 Tax=Oceaniferula spumae TaxID=2979115 RepID=A0AAT9FNU7_9BACT